MLEIAELVLANGDTYSHIYYPGTIEELNLERENCKSVIFVENGTNTLGEDYCNQIEIREQLIHIVKYSAKSEQEIIESHEERINKILRNEKSKINREIPLRFYQNMLQMEFGGPENIKNYNHILKSLLYLTGVIVQEGLDKSKIKNLDIHEHILESVCCTIADFSIGILKDNIDDPIFINDYDTLLGKFSEYAVQNNLIN